MFKPKELLIFLYNLFLVFYRAGIVIASLWDPKAKKWLKGRRGLLNHLRSSIGTDKSPIIWFHCSSLGEFEQGRPILEGIKQRTSRHKILLTFFSPSGFEVRKNYSGADHVFYLPLDSRENARRFLDIVNPCLAIFVKYDYWYYYLTGLKERKTCSLLVSAVFRENQVFFQWWGALQRTMLRCFTKIFVQNKQSQRLLHSITISAIVAGDTRFDSVIQVAENFERLPVIERFVRNSKCVVAGSTWHTDERLLKEAFSQLGDPNLKLIIAPHEIDERHLAELKKLFPASMRLSEVKPETTTNILIIDNIGILTRLYAYGYIAYVGGGFTRDGVHNVLEPAVYGKPVIFGKNYKKYREAIDLLACEAATSFSTAKDLSQILQTWLIDEDIYRKKCEASRQYVRNNKGGVEKILNYIEENRLLTS